MAKRYDRTVAPQTAASGYRRSLNKAFTIEIDGLLSMRAAMGLGVRPCRRATAVHWAACLRGGSVRKHGRRTPARMFSMRQLMSFPARRLRRENAQCRARHWWAAADA